MSEPAAYWLIERNSKHKNMPPTEPVMWFRERQRFAQGDKDIWTPYPDKALRFPTQPAAAEYVRESLTGEEYDPAPDVTEHLDFGPDVRPAMYGERLAGDAPTSYSIQRNAERRAAAKKYEPEVHYLKVWCEFFDDVESGTKPFEIRRNDRDYHVGDLLVLREFKRDPEAPVIDGHVSVGVYTTRECRRRVSYMTDFQQQPGYVVLGTVPA